MSEVEIGIVAAAVGVVLLSGLIWYDRRSPVRRRAKNSDDWLSAGFILFCVFVVIGLYYHGLL